jgi:hypothetical protein
MKHIRVMKWIIALALSAVTVIVLAAYWLSFPSDESLRSRFLTHRADFERLVMMANEDNRLTRIAPDFTWLDDNVAWPRKDVGITEDRWNEYRRLFHTTGASIGIEKGINPSRILFPIDARGIVPTGATKGLVFSQAPLSPVLKSLDKAPPGELYEGPDHNHVLVYKLIEDHWYIYYEEW